MVPHNLYRWNEIGGLQENGNHTDYRVLQRMDKISPTMQVGGPCGMDEPIANTLSHVAIHYASRHDCIDHQWVMVLGFLTGRIGNWKDQVTYNRNVLDIHVQPEQIRDDRSSAGIVYHSREGQQWVPGVHAPTAPASAGRPCRYVNGIFASAVLSTTQTSFDYDVTALYQNGDLLLSAAHHPWLVNPNTIQHLPPEALPQAFRQIGASTHSSILELLRKTVLTSDCFEERTDLAKRINRELSLAENDPNRVHGNEFKICVLMAICCTGLANIGGVDSAAILMTFFWEPPRDRSADSVQWNQHVDADRILHDQRQNYFLVFTSLSWAPIGHQHKARHTSRALWHNSVGSTHRGPTLCKAAQRRDADNHYREFGVQIGHSYPQMPSIVVFSQH